MIFKLVAAFLCSRATLARQLDDAYTDLRRAGYRAESLQRQVTFWRDRTMRLEDTVAEQRLLLYALGDESVEP